MLSLDIHGIFSGFRKHECLQLEIRATPHGRTPSTQQTRLPHQHWEHVFVSSATMGRVKPFSLSFCLPVPSAAPQNLSLEVRNSKVKLASAIVPFLLLGTMEPWELPAGEVAA